MNAGDRHDHRVLDRAKLFKPFSRELFRDAHIVFVNGAKHEHEQRYYYDYDPRAVYELGGNENTEHNEGSDCAYGIDHNGFLPVGAVCHFVRDERRTALLRRLQFCIRQGLAIDSALGEVDVILGPLTSLPISKNRKRRKRPDDDIHFTQSTVDSKPPDAELEASEQRVSNVITDKVTDGSHWKKSIFD